MLPRTYCNELSLYNTIHILNGLELKVIHSKMYNKFCTIAVIHIYLDTWILGVASKQLRLLHGRVGDSTIVVNSLSPQMRELVEDAIAS